MCKGAFSPHQTHFHHCPPSASLRVVLKEETQTTSGNQHVQAVGSCCIALQMEKPREKSWAEDIYITFIAWNIAPAWTWIYMKNICFSGLWCVTWAVVFQPGFLCWGCVVGWTCVKPRQVVGTFFCPHSDINMHGVAQHVLFSGAGGGWRKWK